LGSGWLWVRGDGEWWVVRVAEREREREREAKHGKTGQKILTRSDLKNT